MKTGNHNSDRLLILMMELSIFFLLCIAILNAPHVKGQTIPARGNAIRQKVQEIYTSQIGIREKGINSGPAVAQYLNYVNLPSGNPWCAAFVCWVLGKADVQNPKTGWSPDLFTSSKVIWERAESRKLKVESRAAVSEIKLPTIQAGNPKLIQVPLAFIYPNRQTTDNRKQPTDIRQPNTGDVFGIYFPDKKRIAHAGFIDQWDGTWLITVEGNTTIYGSREGDGVYRKRRPVKSIYQVAGYIPQP
ncbi:hypothetical protein [Daejeonella sp. H1SJ63]|uniref:hypothetical protein n=1 Tax=Daejeonella sp. H1SJ63 TaxID=3034145 RepID=UPI0023EDBBB5|nr:hypothetical protein [Daejeonella sp. H1SJ63]